jgi:hypothetical protein
MGGGVVPCLVTESEYVQLLREEFRGMAAPSGPERRIGALQRGASAMESVGREFQDNEKVGFGADLALEVASYLYSAGAAHPEWRHWAGLAAFGYLRQGEYVKACPYLVLAGEWSCLEALWAVTPGRRSPAAEAVWRLAVGEPDALSWPDGDPNDEGWSELLAAIPAGDQERIDAGLDAVATFWLDEYEGDWEVFHPRSAPDFEPEVCAAAAIARRSGYRPTRLSGDVRRFLEPGLAEGEPEPLYRRLVPSTFSRE